MSDVGQPLVDWVGYCKTPTEAQIVAVLDRLKVADRLEADAERLASELQWYAVIVSNVECLCGVCHHCKARAALAAHERGKG